MALTSLTVVRCLNLRVTRYTSNKTLPSYNLVRKCLPHFGTELRCLVAELYRVRCTLKPIKRAYWLSVRTFLQLFAQGHQYIVLKIGNKFAGLS